MKTLLLIIAICISGQVLSQDSLMYYYNKSTEAYKIKDYPSFLTSLEKANDLRPNHPTLVYNLAAAYSLNENPEKAIETLKRLIMMNSKTTVEGDSDFLHLSKKADFKSLSILKNELEKQIQKSKPYKNIAIQHMHPEGMAYNQKSETFYFGGVNKRNVTSYTSQGEIKEVIDFKADKDIYSVMGIDYDKKKDVIWVCSAAMPEMIDYNDSLKGNSSIIAIDSNGKILKKYLLVGNHVFGDLIVLKDGSVIISDTGENKLYKASIDKEPELLVDLSQEIWNLQGLAITDNGDFIYIADYLSGLYKVNLNTSEVKKIKLTDDVSEKGFDGIYLYKNSIIGVQNGVSPNKTWLLELDKAGLEVTESKVIDQALDILDEPTQGLLIGNRFYYIANSPWAHYEEGNLKSEELSETVILEYTIE